MKLTIWWESRIKIYFKGRKADKVKWKGDAHVMD